MADLKISELTNLTAADPANDMIPIVDVSATPPASGSTKRISINNILACSPTATLASATISGDLTVRTNQLIANANGVGVGTAPSAWSGIGPALQVEQASLLSESSNQLYLTANGYFAGGQWNYINNASADQYYQISGSHVWRNGTGGAAGTAIGWSTLMTLNSTGLGVGVSPGYKLDVAGSSAGVLRLVNINNLSTDPAAVTRLSIDGQGATWHLDNERTNGIFKITRNSTACLTIDNSANVGIGVTPDFKFAVNGTQAVPDTTGSSTTNGSLRIGAPGTGLCIDSGVTAATDVYGWIQARSRTNYATNFNLVLNPNGGNVGIGFVPGAGSFSKVLFIGTGTEPTVGATGSVQYFTSTRSANNTIPAILCEGSGVTNAGITSTTVTHKIAMKVNGTIYYLLATTSAA